LVRKGPRSSPARHSPLLTQKPHALTCSALVSRQLLQSERAEQSVSALHELKSHSLVGQLPTAGPLASPASQLRRLLHHPHSGSAAHDTQDAPCRTAQVELSLEGQAVGGQSHEAAEQFRGAAGPREQTPVEAQ